MNKTIIALILLVTMSGCKVQTEASLPDAKIVTSAIINGKEVVEENIYSIRTVGVKNMNGGTCTGAIIGEDLILTAAHCIGTTRPEFIVVMFGHNFETAEKIFAKNVIVHERYNNVYYKNDLALIRLDSPIPEKYKALDLEESRQVHLDKKDYVTTLGYGVTNYMNSNGVGTLRMASIPVKKFDSDAEFITLNQKKGSGLCFGDSGGPSFVLRNKVPVLIGIANAVTDSRFKRKHGCEYRATITNPNYFYHWIQNSKLKI